MRHPFGTHLRLSIAGASHAPCLRFRLDGFPAGFAPDLGALAEFMERRAPGRDAFSTARREDDAVEFLSGLRDGRTDGTPIRGRIANRDARPRDYGEERTVPRPGHADYPQWVEAGRIPTGGGSNSGRMTAPLCAAGGLCLQWLERRGVRVRAVLESVGGKTEGMEETILAAKAEGDSVGGIVRCEATGLPPGLGGALFDGVESALSAALFAIPGVKGVEFGNGFAAASMRGSENNDAFVPRPDGGVATETNRHGGLLGGRTSGMPVVVRVALKPTPTVFRPQASVDLERGVPATCLSKGRHDPCIARRAVPVVEAVTAFVLADLLMATEAASPRICLTLTGKTLAEDLAQYRSQRHFTDLVELRVDLLDEAERGRVAEFPALVAVPVILTFRRRRDGGAWEGDEESRAAFFADVLRPGCGFAYVDFEDDFRRDDLTAAAQAAGVRVIRSLHDFDGPVPDVANRCRAMRGDTDEIPKVAFRPRNLADVSRLFAETADFHSIPHILCAMGPMGVASRALAVRTHSLLTYASTGGLEGIGHVTPRDLVRTYRIRTVSPAAALYGVTGWPLVFTRSPELNNAAFAAADEDAVMVPFPSPTAEEAIAFMEAMGMRGLAVTYPHKRALLSLLPRIDPAARAIGAVNTVVREGNGLVGYNTDAAGFSAAIRAFLGTETLEGRRVALVGAGGAARAVAYALRSLGADVCIFNRTPEKAAALAADFGFASAPLGPAGAERVAEYADVVVQCAAPSGDPAQFDPLAFHSFTGREWVYDLVYEPDVTPTMARARAAGCRVENGLSMLAAQAAEQRRLYARASGV